MAKDFELIDCTDSVLGEDDEVTRVTGFDHLYWTDDVIAEYEAETGETFPQTFIDTLDNILNSPNVTPFPRSRP